jgi:hypothetical protein
MRLEYRYGKGRSRRKESYNRRDKRAEVKRVAIKRLVKTQPKNMCRRLKREEYATITTFHAGVAPATVKMQMPICLTASCPSDSFGSE